MRTTISKGLLFVALPLALLELVMRLGVLAPPRDPWFDRLVAEACSRKVDAVFAGSSRVAAAVDVGAFRERMAAALGRPVHIINMGRGYTTLAEHDLALRRLHEACPGQMRGADVFVEAPEGLPDLSTFRDSWVHPDDPGLILTLVRPDDVVRLWRESGTPLADKLQVTVRLLRSVDYLQATRLRAIHAVARLRMLVGDRWPTSAVSAAEADLSSAGGVMADAAAVERARRLAVALAPTTFASERRVEDWSDTVLMDLHRFVRRNGGALVTFHMPLSSVQQAPYRTPSRRADTEAFRRAAAGAGIRYLDVGFQTTDDDFPDLWHLRKSRADEFSRRVADQYLAAPATW